MPRRDTTGPMGDGRIAGRGLGMCMGSNAIQYGTGFGKGMGFNRGFRRSFTYPDSSKMQKELLIEQRELLKDRLDFINEQLEDLED